MDDYNGALNPITLRDGELHSASGEGWGKGVLSERVRAPQTHSLTHSHPFSTRRVPSSVRFQNTSHVSSPCTPLKDCNLTYCDIPCQLQGCHKNHGCLMTSETELVSVLPCLMELEASSLVHRSYRNTSFKDLFLYDSPIYYQVTEALFYIQVFRLMVNIITSMRATCVIHSIILDCISVNIISKLSTL